MNQNPGQRGTQQLFIMRIMWAAMCVSVFVMLLVLSSQYGFRTEEWLLGDYFKAELIVFAFMGILNAVVGFFLPKLIVSNIIRTQGAPKNEVDVLRLTFPALILRLAFTEAIMLFGFVAASTVQKTVVVLPFMLLSLSLFLVYFPTYSKLRDLTR